MIVRYTDHDRKKYTDHDRKKYTDHDRKQSLAIINI